MSWSFPIGRLFGSEIRIHVTFFLLLAWIGVAHYQTGGAAAAADGVLFILAIFACVVAHEFGHALVARRYGIRTPDITLLPIGGLARLERMPEKPSEEILVALAGPAVNVVFALILILVLGATVSPEALARLEDPQLSFLARLASVNLFIALFNLIPAFPMDGGRVLRAVLAMRMNRVKATELAARIGQALAFGFGFLGLFGNPFLLFIAIFIYLAATAEAQSVGLQDVARGVRVRDAMITRFSALAPNATAGDAADLLLKTTQHEFPVVDGGGRLRGILTRKSLIDLLAKEGREGPVLDAMTRNIPLVPQSAWLSDALKRLQDGSVPAVGVTEGGITVAGTTEGGRFVGYVTSENVGELMMIRTASASPAAAGDRQEKGPLLPQ
ncbi:site-2 protease family protein [Afifella sp. IM 167]|uniref:site-2 protease family protein n=1 Tax=Afifella sp. IM 167 TaxID=2033586 RepID=UPI001CCB56E1|nr:site-2 protease family protein [Afifella sp. IM 167]MBZ8132776.1 site-2 protease family protein [Afifella sp. IM 167]